MNNIERRNIKIFNLVDLGNSARKLSRVYYQTRDHLITEADILNELGNTPISKQIINDWKNLDDSYYSLYCLVVFDMNMIVIDKIRAYFKTLDDLAVNYEKYEKLGFQSHTDEKIIHALEELNLYNIVFLKREILKEIRENAPIPNNKLKEKVLNKFPTIKVQEYDRVINNLISSRTILEHIDGLKLPKIYIREYLASLTGQADVIIYERLKGKTLQKIADEYNMTKEGIRQIIVKRIKDYPIFQDEEKYFRILNLYKLDLKELSLIGLNDEMLAEYVNIKYRLKPSKSSLDYIADFNLSGTKQGELMFRNHNLVFVSGEVIQIDFVSLMKKFVKMFNIFSFTLNKIRVDFNNFLTKYNIVNVDCYVGDSSDIEYKKRKLENNSYFLNVFGDRFIVFNPDNVSSDLLDELDNYFLTYEGYGSMISFYRENMNLCNKNHIYDENELFTLSKKLYSKKYENKIDFIRNPVIAKKGLNKESYIINFILDMDLPCTLEDYLDYVERITGLKKESIKANYGRAINQYRNSEGLITLDDDVNKEQYNYVLNIIDDKKCVGYKFLYDKVELKYGDEVQKILHNSNLRRIGFVKTNTSVYSDEFNNRLEAVNSALKNIDELIFDENMLYRISNIEYFYYKTYDFIDECTLLKISSKKFLDLEKRGQKHLVKQMKTDLKLCLIEDEIYVLNQFIDSFVYNKWININDEYKDLLNSFDTYEMIKYIVSTIRGLNYIMQGKTFIFSSGELSIQSLIDKIMNENEVLTLIELQEILYSEYEIERKFTNNELSDMGYYCPSSSDKVYLTKEYYEKELEDYLNGDS